MSSDVESGVLRVLVTGGVRGIGRAIADLFLARGHRVAISGTDDQALARRIDETAGIVGQQCDVASEADARELVRWADRQLGGLDVLVNNAGVAGPTGPIDQIDADEWRHTFDVNVHGVFNCTKHAVAPLVRSRGTIVNISSVAGRLGYALRSPYCASKFALAGMTESLARELGPQGVRVNSVLPGFVDSARLEETTQARAEAVGATFEDVEKSLLAKTSLRSKVSERDVAEMVAYLCSPAGRTISGQSLSVCANVEYL